MDRERAVTVVRDIVRVLRRNRTPLAAAGIAYYTLAALVPAVILGFIVLTFIGGEAVAQNLLMTAEDWLAPEGYAVVSDILTATEGRSGVTVFGAAFLVWSVYRMLNGIDVAISDIYGHTPAETVTEKVTTYTVLVAMGGVAVGLTAVFATRLSVYPALLFPGQVGTITQFIALTGIFLSLYYVLSGPEYSLSSTLPGSLLAAGGWTVLQSLYSIYVQYFSTTVYELFGGLLLFLTWLYLGIFVLISGAAVNVSLTGTRETDSNA